MIQGEFEAKIKEGVPVDKPLSEPEPDDENPKISAGYTYLGQFIDHDITFDPASSLDRFNDPDALQDFRTPRLDLDSVYGTGPDDQPFLYKEDGVHFLLGDDKDFNKKRNLRPDLPRNCPLPKGADIPRRALVGDKRNDENTIVSQLHTTFLRFHNKVLDKVANGDFDEAQRIVRWHYQWIVLHDFLRKIVGEKTYKSVIGAPGKVPKLNFYEAKGRYAYMPVEFSVAAYRYGHSQVRPSYALNEVVLKAQPSDQMFKGKKATFNRIPIFSLLDSSKKANELANLNGFRELPDFWAVDWGFFYPGVKPDSKPAGAVLPQPSYKIDTVLVDPLESLPDHQHMPPHLRSLAILNLLRGWRLGLPSGQAVARKIGLEALSDRVLFGGNDPERKKQRAKVLKDHPIFAGNAPLWFYVLREAELTPGSSHLGDVGGTIVAEVLAGLILEDRHSFLSQWPGWTPELPGAKKGDFTISDLINFTNA
jgi:hypothetical protein